MAPSECATYPRNWVEGNQWLQSREPHRQGTASTGLVLIEPGASLFEKASSRGEQSAEGTQRII